MTTTSRLYHNKLQQSPDTTEECEGRGKDISSQQKRLMFGYFAVMSLVKIPKTMNLS